MLPNQPLLQSQLSHIARSTNHHRSQNFIQNTPPNTTAVMIFTSHTLYQPPLFSMSHVTHYTSHYYCHCFHMSHNQPTTTAFNTVTCHTLHQLPLQSPPITIAISIFYMSHTPPQLISPLSTATFFYETLL